MDSILKVNSIYREGSIFYLELTLPYIKAMSNESIENKELKRLKTIIE
jgi:hypothetical protein